MKRISDIRKAHHQGRIDEDQLPEGPLEMFKAWLGEAEDSGLPEYNAMVLANVVDGRPTSRIVLLRDITDGDLVFYTNYESRKGRGLKADPQAALLFFWPELERQVRFEGSVARCSSQISDAYFATRPRESQIGAWASDQSRTIADRTTLDAQYAALVQRFAGRTVDRPPHWGGFRFSPDRVEFWQGRADRMHDRIVFIRSDDGWPRHRLQP